MPPIRVVIADDHTLFRKGLKWILSFEEAVMVVGETSKGDQIVQVVDDTKPDILLLDLRMPQSDTEKAMRELSEKNPAIKVIILTAFSDLKNILNAARNGARGYVLKGVDSSTLLQAIQIVHGGGIWVDNESGAARAFEEIARTRSNGNLSCAYQQRRAV